MSRLNLSTPQPFNLPSLTCTEDAEKFGRSMSKDQWFMCEGARQALQDLFVYLRSSSDRLNACAHIAFKMQVLREAQEVAPFPTLCAILASREEAGHRSQLTGHSQ